MSGFGSASQSKAAMQVYAIAASAGSRGNVGKLRPAGRGESDQRACVGNWILRFPILNFRRVERSSAEAISAGRLPPRQAERSPPFRSAAWVAD
jgi:hypothetical protein